MELDWTVIKTKNLQKLELLDKVLLKCLMSLRTSVLSITPFKL